MWVYTSRTETEINSGIGEALFTVINNLETIGKFKDMYSLFTPDEQCHSSYPKHRRAKRALPPPIKADLVYLGAAYHNSGASPKHSPIGTAVCQINIITSKPNPTTTA